MKMHVAILIVLLTLGVGAYYVYQEKSLPQVSYTPQEAKNLIRISSPRRGERITNPVTITGEARGQWLFEATAPVILTNWDGLIIGEGYIQADGDWMTTNFVSFSGIVTFTKPSFDSRGYLILRRANASDLPEHDASVEIPIFFD